MTNRSTVKMRSSTRTGEGKAPYPGWGGPTSSQDIVIGPHPSKSQESIRIVAAKPDDIQEVLKMLDDLVREIPPQKSKKSQEKK